VGHAASELRAPPAPDWDPTPFLEPALIFDRAPRRIYWEVTRACDLVCRHCRADARPGRSAWELRGAEGLWLLDRIAAADPPAPHLILTGGDPLKRQDLIALISHARARGLSVSVAPSATPLLTGEAIARWRDSGLDAISLSLDGSTARRHDALRGIPGCFDRTVAAADGAIRVGLPFQINTLVCEETLDDLSAIHGVVAGLGATRWSLFFLIAVGRGSVLRQISHESCERLLEWLADISTATGLVITTTEAPYFRRVIVQRRRKRSEWPAKKVAAPHGAGIRDGNGIMFISHTGDVYPSGFLPLGAGNVKTADPVAIYRESVIFRSLRNADLFGGRCGVCEYRWLCGGSRARAFAATGDPLAEDPLCPFWPSGSDARRYPRTPTSDGALTGSPARGGWVGVRSTEDPEASAVSRQRGSE
jgi:AdoMet-dependent heme synthase